MLVTAKVQRIEIPNSFFVAASPTQKRGYVTLLFTSDDGDSCEMQIAKGVALAVQDEIKRMTGSR